MAVAIGVILATLNLIQLMLHAPCNRELAEQPSSCSLCFPLMRRRCCYSSILPTGIPSR